MLCCHSNSSAPSSVQPKAIPAKQVTAGDGPSVAPQGPAEAGQGAYSRGPPAALYNTAALRLWLLRCCQSPRGGFRDKPGKPVDYYHTCYCLSGLASCQAITGGAHPALSSHQHCSDAHNHCWHAGQQSSDQVHICMH